MRLNLEKLRFTPQHAEREKAREGEDGGVRKRTQTGKLYKVIKLNSFY